MINAQGETMAKKQNTIMKWVNFVAFGLLMLGGLNWLLIGLFQFDIFGLFGGSFDGFGSRIFYSLFGVGAIWILGIILYRVFMKDNAPKTKAA